MNETSLAGEITGNETREPVIALPWKPREQHPRLFYDGDQYLVALQVSYRGGPAYWEYAVIRVRCDEDYFSLELDGEPWGWEWEAVEFYIRLSEFRVVT